jgi:hypothetical protein
MNCREFRRKHDAYVDDTLSGVDLDAMEGHRRLCPSCAQVDTRVRRALLVAHNLPTIELSAAFAERLQMRLATERTIRVTMGTARSSLPRGVYTALAAGIFAVAGAAATLTALGHGGQTIRLDPVVATLPEAEPSTLATPAMVASMGAGMAVWPAVFVAQQAPWHFASDAIATEGR